jgi:hypothetical protein
MKPVSLADISYEQGLQLLALRKQALDSGKLPRMPPEALAASFPLRDIAHAYAEKLADDTWMDRLKSGIKNVGTQAQSKLQSGVNQLGEGLQGAKKQWDGMDAPTRTALTAGLAGTGIGAATGVASAMRRGDRRYGRSALRGGLAGAAMGGGLGMALTPGLADKIHGKGSDLIAKAQQYAKPEGDAPGTTPPVLPTDAEAEKLKALAATADSYRPEAMLGGKLVGGGLGTRLAAGKIVNRKSFDTDALADHIWAQANKAGKKGEPGGVDPAALSRLLGVETHNAARNATAAAPTIDPLTGKLKSTKLTSKTMMDGIQDGSIKPNHIAAWLRKQNHTANRFGNMKGSPGFWSNLTGNTGGGTRKAVSDVFGADKLDDVINASSRAGMRNANKSLRMGRARGLGGLALGAGSFLGNTVLNYLTDRNDRSDAAAQLKQLTPNQP